MRPVRLAQAEEGRTVSRQTLALAMALWLVLLVLGFGLVAVLAAGGEL